MRRAVGTVRAAPPAVWALLAAAGIVIAMSANWLIPWLTRDTYVRVATPIPPQAAGVTPIELERRKPVCVNDVLMLSATQIVALAGGNPGANQRPPTIDVTVTAPGYRHATTIASGWPRGLVFDVPSPKSDVLAKICLSSDAKRAVILNGNAGPVIRAYSTVGGERIPAVVGVELRRTDPATRLSRLGTMLDRAADFSWRPLSGGIGRIIVVLVLLLVPIASIGALLWTMEADRRRDGEDAAAEDDPVLTTYHDGA